MADTDQSSDRESYGCDDTLCGELHAGQFSDVQQFHPRIDPSAGASIQRLFDIFTAGQDIYLVSSTSLVDGADALGCAPEFCGMRPATGQLSWGVPFPAVDTAYTGWVRTTSPAPGTFLMNSGRYGLENVQVVIANEGKLLSDFWRDGPVQWAWGNTLGDPYEGQLGAAGHFLARTHEVLVYDVDGTALRFLGRRTADGSWVYRPAQGVFSQLSATVDSSGEIQGFTLRGGAPGNMRAKGGWEYTFSAIVEGDREESTTPYAPLVQVRDPLGNTITITGDRRENRLVEDPISGSSLAIGSHGVTYGKGSSNVTIVDQYGVVLSNLPNQLDPRYYCEPLKYEEGWRGALREVRIGGAYWQPEGSPEVVARYGWSGLSWREQNILNHAFVGRSGGFEGRLISRRVGNLTPTTYSYEWLDETRFKISTDRGGLQTELIYRIDRETGKFLEATYRRPGLGDAWETHEYRFNRHGQVDRWRLSLDGVLKQEATYQFGLDSDPLAITEVTVQYPQDGIRRSWGYGYTERDGETLLHSVQDPTGIAATIEYEDPNYPVLPSALVDGAGHRWEMTYTGPGLLRSLKEPERPAWILEYYPQGHSFQNKLEKIVDPTQREVKVTAYDLFGRPTRVEVRPEGRLLYQEIDWTMLGVPRTVRWSDGTQVDFYWQGSGLQAVRDARRRWVVFDYNLQPNLGEAGLLNRIRIVGPQPSSISDLVWWRDRVENLNSGFLFASLSYDSLGRLTRVAGGNGVGVNYTYGLRDQLQSVRYDGDSRAEQFTYSCCGELKSWTKPDGRTVYFDYKAGLLTHIRLGSPDANPAYTYDYDLAGRLKLAQSNTSWHQWVYEYELPDERRRNTGRLSEEHNLLYGAGISYTHTYTYYPSGEVETSTLNLSTTQGAYQRQLRYGYDDAGRLTEIYYNNQLLASYSYDGAGRLTGQIVHPLGTNATLTATLSYADEQSVGALGTLRWQWNNNPLALFDYDGYDDQPGYYPDGTLARARDQIAGHPSYEWEWDYDTLGQLAYERRRVGTGEWQQTDFSYDTGGNLWGDAGWIYRYNQLLYVPRTGQNNNWYYAYTPNGERWRWWTTDRSEALRGDVNRDGQVDDADLLAVQFAFGRTDCPCPEDLNGDGQVDDADVLIVLLNFGQSAGGALSWEYTYDVWGNLVEVYSPAAGRYRALYDALGRRVGQEIIRETGAMRTYYVYEGDTIVAEVDGSGRIVAEYVWGLLGPIARIDLQNPANTRYYVIDGLGHVRALVSPSGIITDRYTYDSWGNLIERVGDTPNPFTWNGAYGYEFIPFTGLYHVGARAYDPRTARWLQRDPIDVAGGHPNVYAYCGNEPINDVDPTGLDTHVYEYAEFILVVTAIQFRGQNATQANCERVVNAMLKAWNKGFTCGEKPVIFTIVWEIGSEEKPNYDQVWMVPGKLPHKRSYVQSEPTVPSPFFGLGHPFRPPLRPNQQHTCYLYSGDPDYDWMVAHEFGHLIGLGDRYDRKTGKPLKGWEGNIMAARRMPVEQRNIDEFCQLAKKWKAWHVVEK